MRAPLIVLEVVLGFAVPVAWGVWELLALRRDRHRQERAGAGASQAKPAVARSPEAGDLPT